mgnify:FL=1
MEIYEKIFIRLDELHISQLELSKRTGIATSTISDWKKKRINPQADKLVKICRALEMSVIDLLCQESDYSDSEKRLLRYYEMVYANGECKKNALGTDNRSISIICDENGKRVVLINDKKFKGLSKEDWSEVETYLKQYIGDYYEIACCAEKVYIASDFPDEYSNSESRLALKGPRKVAKANASQAIPELIQIAVPIENNWEENKEKKHSQDAKNGWYRYTVRFGIPVYNNDCELERYNIFTAIMLVRHDEDGKKYLYDITTIKKDTSSPLES